jgi:hypothetical protein
MILTQRLVAFFFMVIEPTETELAERVEYDMDEQGRHPSIAPSMLPSA